MLKTTFNRMKSYLWPTSQQLSRSSQSLVPVSRRLQTPARMDKPLRFHIGWTEENGRREAVHLDETDLATHATILGRTGRGKSKLAQLFVREYISHQRGCTVIDPKERLVLDILADMAAHMRRVRCDAILKRVLLVEVTPGSVPLLSAMHWQGQPLGDTRLAQNARTAFLAKEADVLIEIIHQMAGEPQEGAPRIKRLLRDVFVALATVKLEFGDAFVLLDPFHSRHQAVWNACTSSRLLPAEVLADLQMIHELNRPQDKLTQIEGPLNRLRSLLSPLTRACFTNRLKGIDFGRVIRDRQIVLVNASESRFVSQFQAKTIAGMIIHRLIEEAANEDKVQQDHRPPHTLMIDEAAELMGPDIERNLRIGRSLKIPTFLFSQNLSAFKREDKDYRETVLNEPGVTVAFQSKTADELLTNVFLHANRLDFAKATREVDRHHGYDFVALQSVSRSKTNSRTNSQGGATSTTTEQTVTEGTGETNESGSGTSSEQRVEFSKSDEYSEGLSLSDSRSQSRSRSHERSHELGRTRTQGNEFSEAWGKDELTSETTGKNRTDSETSGSHESLGRSRTRSEESILRLSSDGKGYERVSAERDAFDRGRTEEKGFSFSIQESSQETTATTDRHMRTDSYSTAESESQSNRRGTTTQTGSEDSQSTALDQRLSNSFSAGRSSAQSTQRTLRHAVRRDRQIARTSGGSESQNWSNAVGLAEGQTIGFSVSPIARYRTEIEVLPQLQTDIETQRQKFLTELSTLGVAECFLRNDAIGKTLKVSICDVESPFTTSAQYYRAIESVKAKLRALHGFIVEPDMSPAEEARRLDAFITRLNREIRPATESSPDHHQNAGEDDDHQQEAFG